jgi:hypothetical protein
LLILLIFTFRLFYGLIQVNLEIRFQILLVRIICGLVREPRPPSIDLWPINGDTCQVVPVGLRVGGSVSLPGDIAMIRGGGVIFVFGLMMLVAAPPLGILLLLAGVVLLMLKGMTR